MIESPALKPESGRSPETQRRSGPTGGPRPAMAGRPGRRFPPEAATGIAPDHRGGLAGEGGGPDRIAVVTPVRYEIRCL